MTDEQIKLIIDVLFWGYRGREVAMDELSLKLDTKNKFWKVDAGFELALELLNVPCDNTQLINSCTVWPEWGICDDSLLESWMREAKNPEEFIALCEKFTKSCESVGLEYLVGSRISKIYDSLCYDDSPISS